jgi:hypothetical protein
VPTALEHAGDDGNSWEPDEAMKTDRQRNHPDALNRSAPGERSQTDISEHGE